MILFRTSRRRNTRFRRGFTLIELVVVVAIVGVIAALLMTALSAARNRTQRTACLNNLRQINLGMRMYCDDSNDTSPSVKDADFFSKSWSSYRRLMKDYVGVKGEPSARDKLFACPADTFYFDMRPVSGSSVKGLSGLWIVHASLHEQTNCDYSSYAFNGGISNVLSIYTNSIGIGGLKLSSIKAPAKTVLISEAPAFFPYSWHDPGNSSTFGSVTYNNGAVLFVDAKNMVSFVDGHVSFIKIYWDPGPVQPGIWALSMQYEPPTGYDYKWSGD